MGMGKHAVDRQLRNAAEQGKETSMSSAEMKAWDKRFAAAKKAARAAEDKACKKALARARKIKCKPCKRKHVKKKRAK